MQKRLNPFAAAAVAFLLASPALAADDAKPGIDTVVAVVNGVDITLGHIAIAKTTLPNEYQQLPAEVLFSGILDQLISQTALSQSFEGEVPTRIRLAIENERRSLIAGEVVEGVMGSAVTKKNLDEAYDAKYAEAEAGEEYNASHILVETQEEAGAIKEEIMAGADFAETARKKSTGPSGPGGGNLGWFGTGMMVPSFEAAVIELEAGEVSDPVETQFGWHVIMLNETRLKAAPALEDVREELEQQIRSEAVQAHIEKLKSMAVVDRSMSENLDPSVMNEIDLTIQP
ncbi:MAG: peptidylprolyl isomerase [Aliishimia sp.]